jgi:UDP:flavonoid glycosyltransferase YjiC (YdhE family)
MVSRVLYIVAGGAAPVVRVSALVTAAQRRGWDVCLVLTPTAARWLAGDLPDLAARTGHPVRSAYKMPGEDDVLPPADAMLIAPATFNMINQWAAGLSETLALGLINEAIGLGIPLVTVPWINGPLSRHPALAASLTRLREAGVRVIDVDPGPEGDEIPWERVLDALR